MNRLDSEKITLARASLLGAILVFAAFLLSSPPASAAEQKVITHWNGDAATVYDTGFMHKLMKMEDGGVCLFNNDPIENDSPGAGYSDKGVNFDPIWGKNSGRKVLNLDDPRAKKAWVFIFLLSHGKYPLTLEINGHPHKMDTWQIKGYESFRWVEFPAEWLKKGKNVIDFSCTEAQNENEGWRPYLARADEFEAGGGNPAEAGKTSFKSVNGGETWKESPFGPLGQDRCEYEIRICLERHVKTGTLESPVIDLWAENPQDAITRMHTIQKIKMTFASDIPPGTSVEYFFRKGVNPGPFSEGWEAWEPAGSGAAVTLEMPGQKFHRRFLQMRAVLTTANPLVSPVFRSMNAEAEFQEAFPVPRHQNLYVLEADNSPLQYSSVDWKWEKWDRPEFAQLRKRENLDKIIAGSRTQFEAQMRLLDYGTKRWRWTPPVPEYPEWDALSILDRINEGGGGGMCIQFNLLLAGVYQAYGWQARLVSIDGHEICEVWSDDYGKWVYCDASGMNHVLCETRTGQPLNMLELHKIYLDYFYPDRPMDWLNDYRRYDDEVARRADKPPVVGSALTIIQPPTEYYVGFMQSRILRIIPRNNWYEQPFPRPLSHGVDSSWPWDGYLTWYDDRTPPRLQYSWYTNRPRDMWPDLNKVHITATQGWGSDKLYLQFETYTPNFSHYEVSTDDGAWEETDASWVWLLAPGKNTVRVRAVNKQGVNGAPASLSVNHVLIPFLE